MRFLIRKRGEKVKAHYWNGNDTACRMASTGGLRMDRFMVAATAMGKTICHMCQVAVSKPRE